MPNLKIKRRTQAQRTEESGRLMLDAAQTLILEVGTQKTTLKGIGELAGFSRGLAHARYRSKENVFIALVDRNRRIWTREIRKSSKGSTGLEELASRLEAIQSFVDDHTSEALAMYVLWFESIGVKSEINKSLARYHQQAREDVELLVREGELFDGDGKEERISRFAIEFSSLIFGLVYQWLVNQEALDLDKQLESIKMRLLKGQLLMN